MDSHDYNFSESGFSHSIMSGTHKGATLANSAFNNSAFLSNSAKKARANTLASKENPGF